MSGELLNTATVETEAGEYTLSLRFIDWGIPEHRDTQGYAVPKYSIQIEAPDGSTESFTGWGSIHEAETQELTNTDPLDWAENVARDGLVFYHECDGTHEMLDRSLTAEAIKTDLAEMVDNLAKEFSIDRPSEAVRLLGVHMDTARRLRDIGLDYHELHAFNEAVVEQLHG